MIVEKDKYPIPDFQICLTEKEFLKLTSKHPITKKVNFSSDIAAELFNSRKKNFPTKKQQKIPDFSSDKYWFKMTQEVTRDSKAAFIAKLQAFSRTYVELENDEKEY